MAQQWDRQRAEGSVSMADILVPERRAQFASQPEALAGVIRRQLIALSCSEERYQKLKAVPVLFYEQPAAEDQPCTLVENLRMLAEAGFQGIDCFWKQGPFAIFGGYKQVGGGR